MGYFSRKSSQGSVQNSVNPLLRPSSTRSDAWVGFPSSSPDCQDVTWQLISVNIKTQASAGIKVFQEKLLGFERTRKCTPAILSVQETESWDTPKLELKGFVCYGNKNGYASLLVSDKFSTIKRWETKERCTAIQFGTTMVMAVNAPDSKKSLEMFEECIASVVKVLREGRESGAKNFCIAGDINVEMGLMCTDENGEEELTKLCGPQCWQEYDKDVAVSRRSCGMGS